MPRYRRIIHHDELVHFVTRFVNKQYRLIEEIERNAYLYRLGKAIKKTDWKIIAFALMSNHIQLALISGTSPFATLFRSIISLFAQWLNQQQHCLVPVFADRRKTIILPFEKCLSLVTCNHNNPVRAGVVKHAGQIHWTSHR